MKRGNSTILVAKDTKVAILGSEKPWGRYFGCGKPGRALFWLQKNPRAHILKI